MSSRAAFALGKSADDEYTAGEKDDKKSATRSKYIGKAIDKISKESSTGDYSAKKAVAGKDIGKPGKQFSKIAAGAAKRYGSEERGKKVAGAVLAKLRKK